MPAALPCLGQSVLLVSPSLSLSQARGNLLRCCNVTRMGKGPCCYFAIGHPTSHADFMTGKLPSLLSSVLWKQPGQQYLWSHWAIRDSVQFVQGGCCWCRNEPRFCFHPPNPEQIDVTVVVGPNEHDSTVGGRRSNHVSVPYLDIIKNRN